MAGDSLVRHDEGRFGNAFIGSEEIAVNSKSKEAHRLLNTINSLCFRVRRMFQVHLRIHPENIQKYLDELVSKESACEEKAFGMSVHGIDTSIFLSGISFRRRDVSKEQQHYCLSSHFFITPPRKNKECVDRICRFHKKQSGRISTYILYCQGNGQRAVSLFVMVILFGYLCLPQEFCILVFKRKYRLIFKSVILMSGCLVRSNG